jgi:hypothetical protein
MQQWTQRNNSVVCISMHSVFRWALSYTIYVLLVVRAVFFAIGELSEQYHKVFY